MKKTKLAIASASFVAFSCFSTSLTAQVIYSAEGSTYTEDFNLGLPTAEALDITWTNNSVFTGIYADDSDGFSVYNISDGFNGSGELYHYRQEDLAGDGALGGRPNNTSGDQVIALQVRNNTGGTLDAFSLGYTGEQWIHGTGAGGNSFVVSYQLASLPDLVDNTGWNEVAALQFDSPHVGSASTTTLDGSLAVNQTVVSSVETTGLSWADGTDLWIRWYNANESGIDQGIGVEDIVFSATAVPEPSSYAFLASIAIMAFTAVRRRS